MPDPCSYDPRPLVGVPLGMFHCPGCGEMVVAGLPHPQYEANAGTGGHRIDRVTWDDLYPRANPGDEPRPGVYKETHHTPCWRCQRPTMWLSLYWEAPICSFVCDDLAWHEYGRDVWGVGWDTWPDNLPPQQSPLEGIYPDVG